MRKDTSQRSQKIFLKFSQNGGVRNTMTRRQFVWVASTPSNCLSSPMRSPVLSILHMTSIPPYTMTIQNQILMYRTCLWQPHHTSSKTALRLAMIVPSTSPRCLASSPVIQLSSLAACSCERQCFQYSAGPVSVSQLSVRVGTYPSPCVLRVGGCNCIEVLPCVISRLLVAFYHLHRSRFAVSASRTRTTQQNMHPHFFDCVHYTAPKRHGSNQPLLRVGRRQ